MPASTTDQTAAVTLLHQKAQKIQDSCSAQSVRNKSPVLFLMNGEKKCEAKLPASVGKQDPNTQTAEKMPSKNFGTTQQFSSNKQIIHKSTMFCNL